MKKVSHTTYYVPCTFRCLTDEQVGRMQVELIDNGRKAADVGMKFGVSLATVYRVKNAVPRHLITIKRRYNRAG